MDRRDFLKSGSLMAGSLCLGGFASWKEAFAAGTSAPQAGKALKPWKKGQLQFHFIYTGVGESIFCIFPDGTSMLIDCGDHNAIGRGAAAVPVLPNSKRHAGEWIARYVERVNPHGTDVDYMMLTHYHNDHGGCTEFYASKEIRDGEMYYLSGFTQAGEFLHFHKGIDRSWPGFNIPFPQGDDSDGGAVRNIKNFYNYHQKHNGLQVEQFRLGAEDQIVPVHDRNACKDFVVRNICGNGCICYPDGTIKDLYKERIEREHLDDVSENGMSLGMIFSYGDFKLYTAGDFSDDWDMPDGSNFKIEDAIADVCPRVNVAKINHHGHHSLTAKLVKALAPRVFVSCVWDQHHNLPDTMGFASDRSLYPGERIICPTIMPAERRAKDAGSAWLNDVDPSSFEGGHVVITVEKGGKDYSLAYLTADDESMTVRSMMHFKSDE